MEGTGCSCLVSAVSFQGTGLPRTTRTRGKGKNQPRPKPSHSPDVMGYQEETKRNRFQCSGVRGKVLSLCTKQNIQVSKYSGGLRPLSPRRRPSTPRDAPTWRGREAGRGGLTSPSGVPLHPTSMQSDVFKNWWLDLRNHCGHWEQGRSRNKCTELVESGVVGSSGNVDGLPWRSTDSCSPKFHQGSLPFSVGTETRQGMVTGFRTEDWPGGKTCQTAESTSQRSPQAGLSPVG